MSIVSYRPLESPVAQMSVVAGLVASTAQALSLSFHEKSVLLRICQSFGSSVTYDVYRSVDGVVDSEPMVSGVSDAFYLSVVLGQENSILVLSLRADGYYPILLTVSYLYEKDLLFISQVGVAGDMKYKIFNSTELSQNLDYTIDSFTAVPDLSIDTLPKVIDFLSGFVTTDNLKQYIADQIDVFEIVQGPGNSTTAVMSQNAVTEELLQKVGVDAVVDTTGNSSNLVMSQASVTEELSKKASVESVTDGISAHNTSSTSHADIRELLNTCVGLPAYDSSSYKITFTTLAGASVEIDLPIEQLALRYNAETESIEFDNADGTTTSIPVSAFVKEYVGSIGDRIQISIDENNVIHATVLKNSIDWDCLSVDLQARINDHVTSADFASKVVRTDIAQSLSLSAQNQALENIGADLMIIDLVNGQATLTDDQEDRLLSCKGVILRGTTSSPEILSRIFHMDNSSGNIVAFYSFRNGSFYLTCQYTKSTRTFSVVGNSAIRDNSAVVFNRKQSLTTSQQAQALSNLGMKVYVTDSSFLGSTLSAEEIEQVAASKVLLFTDTGDLFLFGSQDSNRISFYKFSTFVYVNEVRISKLYGFVSGPSSYGYRDKDALHFTAQNPALTSAQQEQAWSNLGLDLVVLKFPEGAPSVVLTDEEDAKLRAGAAVLLTVDGTNTGVGIYNADNHIFTSTNFASVPEPIFYSLWSNTLALYCSYKKASKTFVFNGNLLLNDAGALRFDRTTSLTTSQQDTALSNIGLPLVHVDYSLIGSTLDDSTYNKLLTAKGIILENVPDRNNSPSLCFVGSSDTVTTTFVSEFNERVRFVLTLSHIRKKLSLRVVDYVTDVVRYGESQNLTDTQKDTALSNIGLDFVHVDYSLLGTPLSDANFNKIWNAKGLVISGNDSIPMIFTRGRSNS